MNFFDKAVQNLEEHGIELDRPSETVVHEHIDSDTQLQHFLEEKSYIKTASYQPLTDKIKAYLPISELDSLTEMDKEEIEKITEAYKDSESVENYSKATIFKQSSEHETLVTEAEKAHKIYSLLDSKAELDPDIEEKMRSIHEEKIVQDIEHELLHTYHYQTLSESEPVNLQEEYERYMKDVENLGEEVDAGQEKLYEEGISRGEWKKAAAIKVLEDEYNNLVEQAEEKYQELEEKIEKTTEKYSKEIEKKSTEIEGQIEDEEVQIEYWGLKEIEIEEILQTSQNSEEAMEKIKEGNSDRYKSIEENIDDSELLEENLKQIYKLKKEKKEKTVEVAQEQKKVKKDLKDEIMEKSQEYEEFQEIEERYNKRKELIRNFPEGASEAIAQFWTFYRNGVLDTEKGREQLKKTVSEYNLEDAEETVDSLLEGYEQAEGTQKEKVIQVMDGQIEQIKNSYNQ